MSVINQEEYWAATEKDDILVQNIQSKISEYYNYIEESRLYYMWQRSYLAYYGSNLSNSGRGQLFDAVGLDQQGQITRLKVNHYRNVLKHTLQLATAKKPAFACRASNTDYKSQAQTVLGNGLVDYYMREKKLSRVMFEGLERALVFGEGWVYSAWNKKAGEIYIAPPEEMLESEAEEQSEILEGEEPGEVGEEKTYGTSPLTGAPIYEGDLDYTVHSPLDVVRDVELENDKHQWLILRSFVNKWDLAAENPDFRDDIINIESGYDQEQLESFSFNISYQVQRDNKAIVYTLFHEPSPSLPQGRMVKMAGSVILFDGAIPYRKMPLFCVKPDSLLESPFGYSPAFEILGIQQGIDVISTAIMTNNATNAVQNIWTKKGDGLSANDLSGGMKHLQSEEPPQPINLTRTAPETYNFLKDLEKNMETISGISSTVRGNPETSLKSGSALALVVSQSIQYASLFEQSYNELLEDLGTAIIDNLRDFSKTPRVAAILGESSRPFQKEFTGDDLSQINRVVVEQGSALSKTISGRVEIATQLMNQGMIETPKQYITVLTTGQLDPAIEGSQHSMLNIRSENEDMQNGEGVQAIITENHADHIREHKTIIENPDAKKQPELIARVLGHIQDHLDLWRQADMAILMITGQQPPPPPPGQMPPQQGGQPPQPGQPQPTKESMNNGPMEVMQAQGAVPQDMMPSAPSLPKMPIDPATNEPF